ncbi:hypothetical protein NARC_190011 [Candidatus Nitrosocosmicus arcticus]|uniref:Uncharacterized protein n=1 Tax=Candidatus Nitrosocosmicus arcticus TaxID=2035267 RepID=A0A557SRE4_9ARCH|nr:hypothetical protein NARC_190011 [Candidatus Nitrosocosmicus arcticus]
MITFAMASKRHKIKAETLFDGKADSYILGFVFFSSYGF